MTNGIVHGDVFQFVKAFFIHDADPVSGTDPEVAVDVFKLLDLGQR